MELGLLKASPGISSEKFHAIDRLEREIAFRSGKNIEAKRSQVKPTTSSSSSEGSSSVGPYKMNFWGWMNDWLSWKSYDWEHLEGVGYLLPKEPSAGSRWSVFRSGSRKAETLDGYFNFVYLKSAPQKIRLSPKSPVLSPPDETVHSQIAGGKSVDCAGELQFAGGQLRYINTQSGHYYKDQDWNSCTAGVFDELKKMGYAIHHVSDRPHSEFGYEEL